jgi:hypothetical protein
VSTHEFFVCEKNKVLKLTKDKDCNLKQFVSFISYQRAYRSLLDPYYASSVWLTPSLNAKLKSNLFSSSGKILSTIEVNSYKNLHKKFTRATPEMWLKYELAISLYDLNVTKLPLSDWQLLQINTLKNRRSTKLHFTATNKLRCGLNILPNRFKTITNRIDTNWLSLTKDTYKQKCKKEFIISPLLSY